MMRTKLKALFSWGLVVLMATAGVATILTLSTSTADARGFRRSRFRSSRSSRRSWGGSRRRSTYRPKTRRAAPRTRSRPSRFSTGRSTGSSRRRRGSSSPMRSLYRAGQARRMGGRLGGRRSARYSSRNRGLTSNGRFYRRAAAAGLAFATYSLARDHFRRTQMSRYPVAFAAEPSPRPSYVPATMTVDGKEKPVVWSSKLGSYAVQKDGALVPYSFKSDRDGAGAIMTSAGYYWGPKPSRQASSGGGSIFGLLAGAIVFFILLAIGFVVLRAIKRSLFGTGSKAIGKDAANKALAPPPGVRHDETTHPDYWMQLAVEDFIVINDFQAFEDALDGPKGMVYGDDFRVGSLVRMRGKRGAWDAVLAELTQIGMQSLYLLAWRENGLTQLSVYYVPAGFSPSTRVQLLDRDETWLFGEPTRDDWRPGELTFNRELTHVGTAADGREEEQLFAQVPGGSAAGDATPEPGPRKLEAVTVARWRCATAAKNPLMLMVELGAGADMMGGQLRLWLGTPLESHEIDMTPANIRSAEH